MTHIKTAFQFIAACLVIVWLAGGMIYGRVKERRSDQ